MSVPGHVGLGENETSDRAAGEALDKKPTDDLLQTISYRRSPTDDLMASSNVRPLTTKYIYTKFGWKNGINLLEYPLSFMRFYQSFRQISVSSFCHPGKEGRVLNIAYWSLLSNAFVHFENKQNKTKQKKPNCLLFVLHLILLLQSDIFWLCVQI